MSKFTLAFVLAVHARRSLGFGWFGQQEQAAAPAPAAPTSDFTSLPAQASDFLGGCIDTFFGESEVSVAERSCLSSGARKVTSRLSLAWDQSWLTYTQFQKQAASVAAPHQPAAGAPYSTPYAASLQSQTAASPVSAAISPGEAAVLAMEFAASLSNLYKVQSEVAQSCLHGNAVDELMKAARHLGNMTYVGGRLVSNGVDIVDELSAAFSSYEHKDFRSFGKDMGTACRRVLLATRSSSGSMTFHMPSASAISEVTEGLFASFFGRQVGVQIMTDAVPVQMQGSVPVPAGTTSLPWEMHSVRSWDLPAQVEAYTPVSNTTVTATTTAVPTEYPATTLSVDLHTCVAGNMPLLKSAWEPVFALASSASKNSAPPSISDLMLSMMDLQAALTRCNIGPAQEAMLIDALHAGTRVQTKLQLPSTDLSGSRVSALLASALEDFRNKQWYAFGSQLGAAMRDMVVMTFSEKYEVDDSGRLRMKLIGASALETVVNTRKAGFTAAGLFSIALVSLLLLSVATVLRRRRIVQASPHACPTDDRELDIEAVE